MTTDERGVGALSGLKIVDFTHALAGPFCTMVLADLGADVLKVEPPYGDGTRRIGPFHPSDMTRAYGGYFQSVNRNKRSIAIDLRRPEGREVLFRLLDGADALVENFRAGTMDRLGLSFESLHARYPRLVYAAIRGFGDPRTGASPYTGRASFDIVAQAYGGLVGITGPGPGRPLKTGGPVGDVVPALFAAVGILAAVLRARETGEGQFVDVALYDGVLALCERIVYQFSYGGEVPEPEGNGHPLLCPFDLFPARDGWVAIAAPGDRHWQYLCDLMGRPELKEDERFSTSQARVARCNEVRQIISAWTSLRTKHEIVQLLGDLVPCGPVNNVRDIFSDLHVERRQMLVEVEQPGLPSPVVIAGPPIKMTATPSRVRHRAPLLGEHTDEVLRQLGYSNAEIARLRDAGAVC